MNKDIKAIPIKLAKFLVQSEEETIKRFMEIAGLKDEYESTIIPASTPKFSYKWRVAFCTSKNVYRMFSEAGYTIEEQQLKNSIDGVMIWRMTLFLNKFKVCHQDIEIHIKTRRSSYE